MAILSLFCSFSVFAQTTINTSGTYTVPPGVTSIKVYLTGGGGAGGGTSTSGTNFFATGGGGGGALGFTRIAVTPGDIYTVTIGAGGIGNAVGTTAGGNGGTTTFSGPAGTWTVAGGSGAPIPANGATSGALNAGGAGGNSGTGLGLILFAGGNGSSGNNGTSGTTGVTGNGGGGGGSGSNGTSPASTCGVTGFGGTGTFPGGNGGVSLTCAASSADGSSAPGLQPGGGGSGVKNWLTVVLNGGAGGAGRVVVETTAGCGSSPTLQPTGLILTPTLSTAISGSFTPAAGSEGYLVVRYPAGSSVTDPVNGTSYANGSSLGAGTIVSGGQGGSTFSATGLAPSTSYDFYVYSMNTTCTGAGYLTTTPLFLNASTPAAPSSTALGGLWSSPQTWANGVVPSSVEDITIVAGAVITVDQVVTAPNLTISGTLQWNATANAMTLSGNLTINPGGKLLAYTTGQAGVGINIAGNYTNNGYANHAATLVSGFALNFNGAGSTLSGTGVFEGDGTNGIIRSLAFQNLGANTISTSQNLIVIGTTGGGNGFGITAGSLNTNGKLKIDNTAQVYGSAFNRQVASIVVPAMGSNYSVAPVVFGASVTQWAAISGTLNTLYVSGNNVYRCTAAGSIGGSAPTHTSGITDNLLWIGTVGTLGNPFQVSANTVGTQYFYGNNLYTCIAATGVPVVSAPPTCTSGTCVSVELLTYM